MTDPSPPEHPDDARDPRVADWLAVEPLDEVTRARLVRAALEGDAAAGGGADPGASRHRRWSTAVAVAAVLLVGVVVALAVVASRGRDTTTTAERPARDSGQASRRDGDSGSAAVVPEAAPTAGADDGTAEASVSLTLPSVGDLGDVSTEAALADAARSRTSVPFGSTPVTVTGCAVAAARALGTPVGAGTGTLDGAPATVVVVEQPAGTTAVVAVRGSSCGRAVSVVLP